MERPRPSSWTFIPALKGNQAEPFYLRPSDVVYVPERFSLDRTPSVPPDGQFLDQLVERGGRDAQIGGGGDFAGVAGESLDDHLPFQAFPGLAEIGFGGNVLRLELTSRAVTPRLSAMMTACLMRFSNSRTLPRPGMMFDGPQGGGIEGELGTVEVGGQPAEEGLSDEGNVPAPLAEGGTPEGDATANR